MSASEGSSLPGAMPVTRGFLFADLRGYTDYVEAHGDAAAADLLAAYRRLVREVLVRYDGSEIKTEGDSFYVVFPSASGAVRCGLDIVAGAASVAEPPIRVGIGIHAGESVEDDSGYVGLAVNIAARICAQARSGEVLVSETVRSLARGGGQLIYTSRGRRQLKGIREPIAVYAVADARLGGGARVGRRAGRLGAAPSRRTLAGVALGGLAVLAVGLVGWTAGLGRPNPTASPGAPAVGGSANAGVASSGPGSSATPSGVDLAALPISDGLAPHVTARPGAYETTNFDPRLTFRLSTGWEALMDEPDAVELSRQTVARGQNDGALTFSRSRVGFAGPCAQDKTVRIGDTTDAVLDWLQHLPYLHLSDPAPVSVGGASGVRLEGTVDSRDAACPGANPDATGWYALLRDSRGDFYVKPGSAVAFSVLDVDRRPVLMIEEWPSNRQTDFEHEVEALLVTLDFQ